MAVLKKHKPKNIVQPDLVGNTQFNQTQRTPKQAAKWTKWFDEKWRPAMAWQYIAICLFDFLLAPMLTGWFAWKTGITYVPWKPISLSESGLYHMAMLTILGVATWSRGQEKIRSMEITRVDPDHSFSLTPPPGFTQDAPLNVPPGYPDPSLPPSRTNPNMRF